MGDAFFVPFILSWYDMSGEDLQISYILSKHIAVDAK